jgi:hypothetical protein
MRMRSWPVVVALLGSGCCYAQVVMPVGIIHGSLISLNGSARSGDFTVRNPQNAEYRCNYDARTYFEREHHMIRAIQLDTGESVEVVADRKPGSSLCYARIVQVVNLTPLRRPSRVSMPAPRRELFPPRGNLTYGGIVLRRDGDIMVVRTRDGEMRFILRPDTRYVGGGLRTESSELQVNTRVFIRCGRGSDGDLEAFQIAWGDILSPE